MTATGASTWAFMFTDLVGSTTLWEHHPDQMTRTLARHDEICAAVVGANGGDLFKHTGDGIVAAFADAAAAARAAIALHVAFDAELWPPETPISARIGIHVGSAEHRGNDYFGAEVSRAARIMGAAQGRQVLVSAAASTSIISAGFPLVDLGTHRFKGLIEPVLRLPSRCRRPRTHRVDTRSHLDGHQGSAIGATADDRAGTPRTARSSRPLDHRRGDRDAHRPERDREEPAGARGRTRRRRRSSRRRGVRRPRPRRCPNTMHPSARSRPHVLGSRRCGGGTRRSAHGPGPRSRRPLDGRSAHVGRRSERNVAEPRTPHHLGGAARTPRRDRQSGRPIDDRRPVGVPRCCSTRRPDRRPRTGRRTVPGTRRQSARDRARRRPDHHGHGAIPARQRRTLLRGGSGLVGEGRATPITGRCARLDPAAAECPTEHRHRRSGTVRQLVRPR